MSPLDALYTLRVAEPESAHPKLRALVGLISKWNKVYNLTAIRDPDEMWRLHILDSLSLSPHLPAGRLLDVGSGAGLPGLPLAIVRPDLEIVSVDSVEKKVTFQRQAAAELGLTNHRAIHARVETLALPPFPAITSRAFSSLEDFVRLTQHLLAPDGAWYAMKGDVPKSEIVILGRGYQCETVPLAVPGLEATRNLVRIGVHPSA